MKRRILSLLCALSILLSLAVVPAYAADGISLQDSINVYDSGVIKLDEDASDITVTKDVIIDLNGHNITGVTVTGGTLYCMDSQTADYSVADGVYGKVTDVTGNVAAAEGYLSVNWGSYLSFHCVDLQIKSMSLRPGNAGVYYTSNFAGDEVVSEQVLSYGIALSVAGEPTAENMDKRCAYSVIEGFEPGTNAANGTLLIDVMSQANTDGDNQRYAAMPVYGRAYIKTVNGYVFGKCVSRDFRSQVEAIDGIFGSLNATQKAGILELYNTYTAVMESWNIPNIRGYALGDIVITVPVQSENGVVTESVTVEQDGVSITIPFGTLLEAGSTELTLNITKKQTSDSGIEAAQGQTLMPFDVHVEGVSSENTVPLTVALGKVMPENLNMGNYTVYHVEESGTNPMELVANDAEFTDHNQYKYTLDGELTLHMATFSEVAVVSEDDNGWKNGVDHSWYLDTIAKATEEGTTATYFEIRNADQLWSFSQIVGGMADDIDQDSFSGKTVKLLSDIDLADSEVENDSTKIFYPIGYYNSEKTYEKSGSTTRITSGFYTFEGTFDGNGNTISNFYQNTWEMKGDNEYYAAAEQCYRDGMGLFGKISGATVKNLTVENFSSDGEYTTTGTIAAYADCGATFENIAITNCNPRVYNIGNGGIVGCIGWYAKTDVENPVTFKNITVDNSNKISALWGSWDVACGGLVGQYYPTSGQSTATKNKGIHFENCHVSAQIDVYNDVCANYQYYAYRYAGMMIGSIRENETINGHVYPKMDDITASNCTVHFGTWNDYYYCEIVDNTTASYTHDYQMSRLVEIKAIDGTTVTYLDGTTGTVPATGRANYVIVDYTKGHGTANATCYHFKDGEVWNHEDGGYDVGIDENGDGQDDLKEDKQHIYLEFNNLFTGYGWGVTSKGITDYEESQIKILDREVADSVVKFEKADTAKDTYTTSTTVTIGELFKVATIEDEKLSIKPENVQVTVSPADPTDITNTVSATYVPNTTDWTKGTLTFSGTGAAKITITDYYFCTPTVIEVTVAEPADVVKFQPVKNVTVVAGEAMKLGELFTAISGAEIDDANIKVTINGEEYDYSAQTVEDWSNIALSFDAEDMSYTVAITDQDYCVESLTMFTTETRESFTHAATLKNVGKYLYRVGNKNAIKLNTLFAEQQGATINGMVYVTVESLDENVEVTYSFNENVTWTAATLDFADTFTGPVGVTIDALGADPYCLDLEVVNAKNVVDYSELVSTSCVLLDDITMTKNGKYSLYDYQTLYGNGFTFDVAAGLDSDTEGGYVGGNATVWVRNSTLDNVVIVGEVYTKYGGTVKAEYNFPTVLVLGDSVIANSYISNGSSPVRVGSGCNVEIINTTLEGGIFANLDIRGGTVKLRDVITINQSKTDGKSTSNNQGVVGLGIVVYTGSTVTIDAEGLTQYNCISENTTFTATEANKLKNVIFGTDYSDYQFTHDGATWVNTGIISMVAEVTEDNFSVLEGYGGQEAGIAGYDGYVYAPINLTSVAAHPAVYTPSAQYQIAPSYKFDYTTKNNVPQVSGSNDYCVYDESTQKYLVSFDDGETFTWDADILTLTRGDEVFDISVAVSGDAVVNADNTITFDTAGDYTVTYTYTDKENYRLNNGEIEKYSADYEKKVNITVYEVVDTSAKTDFAFGSNGYRTETANNLTYVMPDVNVIVDSNTAGIGVITVDGKDIYYPIVSMHKSGTSSWYNYFSVFEAVTITDMDGTVHSTSSTELPSGLTVIGGFILDADGNISTAESANGTGIFNYSTGKEIKCATYSSYGLCYYPDSQFTKTGTSDRAEQTIVAKYRYTDSNGTPYYYYVGYWCENHTKTTICVTPDTLVTMADGSQKRIDEVSYGEEIVVWNFYTGEFDTAPVSLLVDHGYIEQDVVELTFSDGTVLNFAGMHGAFNADLNEFVDMDASNAQDFVGDTFLKQSGKGFESVKLESVRIKPEYNGSITILSAGHYNAILNGMLTISPSLFCENLYEAFEVGEGVKYDEEKMQADIEKYGLYTYEDFAEYVTYEQFVAWNLANMKVVVGKGYATYETIVELLETVAVPNA